jgi:hypothetical protein
MEHQFAKSVISKARAIKPSDFIEPTLATRRGERVIGTLTDELKSFYTAMARLDIKTKVDPDALQKKLETLPEDMDERDESPALILLAEHTLISSEMEILNVYFWQKLIDTFNPKIGKCDLIGVRKNWEVVIFHHRTARPARRSNSRR